MQFDKYLKLESKTIKLIQIPSKAEKLQVKTTTENKHCPQIAICAPHSKWTSIEVNSCHD